MALLMAAAVGACGREVVPEPTEPVAETSTGETTEVTTATTTVTAMEWTTATPAKDYDEMLERYWKRENEEKHDRQTQGKSSDFSISFMLYDLDGDFVQELFVSVYSGGFSYAWDVYTMQAGKTYWLGNFPGQAAEDFYSNPEGGIYCMQVHGGIGAVSRITKQGNRLVVGGFVPLDWTDEEGNRWELPQNSVELTVSHLSENDDY